MQYTKNNKLIELYFLEDQELISQEYRDFINSKGFRGFMHVEVADDLHKARLRRIEYYKAFEDFKILCVKVDGKIVGQSCALKTYAIANGRRIEWWWGVDVFLMTRYRGLGIGKNMQKILHDQLPNFSSAFYTPINGSVKKKCGAHGIADIYFAYYSVSSFLSVFADLSFRKLFKKPFPFRIRIPYLYSNINGLFYDSRLHTYTIQELKYDDIGQSEADFMEWALSFKDFHIERSEHFLKWKYKSLKAGFHMLKIMLAGETEAIVAFSNVYDTAFDVAPVKGVTIYDMVISPKSKLTTKRLLLFIARWYKLRGKTFDGFQILQNIHYFGKLIYPFHSCQVLSTLDGICPNIYLTYADQDMDQI